MISCLYRLLVLLSQPSCVPLTAPFFPDIVWPHFSTHPRRQHPGVYGSYVYGKAGQRIQVILLDTRYFKSPWKTQKNSEGIKSKGYGRYTADHNPKRTILGAEQWGWLEQALKEEADIRFVVSSFQIIPDQRGQECWGDFPHERTRLLEFLGKTDAKGVMFLAGDVHFSEMSIYQDHSYPLYEFTSSAMAHQHNTKDGKPTAYSSVPNEYRLQDFTYTADSYGEIDVEWKGLETRITMRIVGNDQQIIRSTSVLLSDLEPEPVKE